MAGMIGLRTAPGIKKCELIPIRRRHFAIDDGFQRFGSDLRFQAPVKFTRMTRNNVERLVKGFGSERSNSSFLAQCPDEKPVPTFSGSAWTVVRARPATG
jgi:hypothetical protein